MKLAGSFVPNSCDCTTAAVASKTQFLGMALTSLGADTSRCLMMFECMGYTLKVHKGSEKIPKSASLADIMGQELKGMRYGQDMSWVGNSQECESARKILIPLHMEIC